MSHKDKGTISKRKLERKKSAEFKRRSQEDAINRKKREADQVRKREESEKEEERSDRPRLLSRRKSFERLESLSDSIQEDRLVANTFGTVTAVSRSNQPRQRGQRRNLIFPRVGAVTVPVLQRFRIVAPGFLEYLRLDQNTLLEDHSNAFEDSTFGGGFGKIEEKAAGATALAIMVDSKPVWEGDPKFKEVLHQFKGEQRKQVVFLIAVGMRQRPIYELDPSEMPQSGAGFELGRRTMIMAHEIMVHAARMSNFIRAYRQGEDVELPDFNDDHLIYLKWESLQVLGILGLLVRLAAHPQPDISEISGFIEWLNQDRRELRKAHKAEGRIPYNKDILNQIFSKFIEITLRIKEKVLTQEIQSESSMKQITKLQKVQEWIRQEVDRINDVQLLDESQREMLDEVESLNDLLLNEDADSEEFDRLLRSQMGLPPVDKEDEGEVSIDSVEDRAEFTNPSKAGQDEKNL